MDKRATLACMDAYLNIAQYQGFFTYGEAYGHIVEGEEVEFRLFIETLHEGVFTGRVIDWGGCGADGEVAAVRGYVEEGHISFIKQYEHYHEMDEWGRKWDYDQLNGHKVIYEGQLDEAAHTYYGTWEIESSDHQMISSGTWRMRLQE